MEENLPKWFLPFKEIILKLLEAVFGKQEEKPEPPPPPPAQPVKVVKIDRVPEYGQTGAHVKALQDALVAYAGAKLKGTGTFGPDTKKAVSAFQKSKGLAGSGVLGPKTLKFLGLEVEIKVIAPSPDGTTMARTPITKDLQGKKGRHLHPELRAMIEAIVFPGGVVPQEFKDKDVRKCAIIVAKALLKMNIRESGGNNRGKLVGFIQGVIGVFKPTGTGDAWCKSTMQVIVAFLEDYFQVESPVTDSEHCQTVNAAAKKVPGLWTDVCEVAAMFEFKSGDTTNGHTGIVIGEDGEYFISIEGNTGDKSLSDGDGVFQKRRHKKKNGNFTTLGYVRFYPYNKVA